MERERERRNKNEPVSACAEKPTPMYVLEAAWNQQAWESRAGLQDTVIIGTEVCEHISNGHISDSGSQDDSQQPR